MFIKKYISEFYGIIQLSFPIIISQIGLFIVQLVDTLMVGRLGAKELAAVAFGSNIYFFIYIFGIGIVSGVTPIIGKYFTQNNKYELKKVLHNAILLFSILGVILSGLQILSIPLLSCLGQPHEILSIATPYYVYLSLSTIPLILFCIFRYFIEGIGNTKVVMIIILISNLTNIILNYAFIYGELGCKALGAPGAGLATLISRIIMFFLIIIVFVKKNDLRTYISSFTYKSFSISEMRHLVSIGLPIALQMTLEGCAFAVTGIIMGWFGSKILAANQIAIIIANLSFLIISAIASATTIKVSHYLGLNSFKRISIVAKCSFIITICFNLFTIITLFALKNILPYFFTTDSEVAIIVANFLIYVCMYQFPDGIQCVSVGILRGMQDVKMIPVIAFIAYFVINVPLGCLLGFFFNYGPKGLWYGYIGGLSFAAFYFYRRYIGNIRKEKILEPIK